MPSSVKPIPLGFDRLLLHLPKQYGIHPREIWCSLCKIVLASLCSQIHPQVGRIRRQQVLHKCPVNDLNENGEYEPWSEVHERQQQRVRSYFRWFERCMEQMEEAVFCSQHNSPAVDNSRSWNQPRAVRKRDQVWNPVKERNKEVKSFYRNAWRACQIGWRR